MNVKKESTPAHGFDLHAPLSDTLLEKSFASGRLPADGTLEAKGFTRLLSSVVSIDSSITWSFAPDAHPVQGRRRWWLKANVSVSCTCERCLMPVAVALEARRGFEFFKTASQADAMTEESMLDGAQGAQSLAEIDYLSPEDQMTLMALIEDELLLSLPMAPKHSDCRAPANPVAEDEPGTRADEPETVKALAGLKDLLKKP
jgi:uncharacterized protein